MMGYAGALEDAKRSSAVPAPLPAEPARSAAAPSPSLAEQRQAATSTLVRFANQHVVAAYVMFDLILGVTGFHRSEIINLDWSELTLCFGGATDSLNKGKRRYNGPVVVEKAHHFHSDFGPFCCRGAIPYRATDIVSFVRDIMLPNLRNWVANPQQHGTCSMCNFVFASIFLNILYWAQLDEDKVPTDVLRFGLGFGLWVGPHSTPIHCTQLHSPHILSQVALLLTPATGLSFAGTSLEPAQWPRALAV